MKCRHCDNELSKVFLDLGFAPPSNAYVNSEGLQTFEKFYPLKLFVCGECWLVQTDDYTNADDLFNSEYAYFSSVSTSWLEHARNYTELMIDKLKLDKNSFVVEVASNDGYLLKNFVEKEIPCLGIEPTKSTADAAEKIGVPVMREFFGESLAGKVVEDYKKADLIAGNNVYAHVPDINDFTRGLKSLLAENGVITLEFPHLYQLIKNNQFDTVYHEHFSYLSLHTVDKIFNACGLRVFDVDELSTHGGSIRAYGVHLDDEREVTQKVTDIKNMEMEFGMRDLNLYQSFQDKANRIKDDLLSFLIDVKNSGKKIAAYGAAAKGNTLLNYAGVKPDLLPTVYDAAPSKQGKYLPGSHIYIKSPSEIKVDKPDVILILPWNISKEVTEQLSYIKEWGGEFAVAIPEMKVLKV